MRLRTAIAGDHASKDTRFVAQCIAKRLGVVNSDAVVFVVRRIAQSERSSATAGVIIRPWHAIPLRIAGVYRRAHRRVACRSKLQGLRIGIFAAIECVDEAPVAAQTTDPVQSTLGILSKIQTDGLVTPHVDLRDQVGACATRGTRDTATA